MSLATPIAVPLAELAAAAQRQPDAEAFRHRRRDA